jgi:hypothetical protein
VINDLQRYTGLTCGKDATFTAAAASIGAQTGPSTLSRFRGAQICPGPARFVGCLSRARVVLGLAGLDGHRPCHVRD